MKNSLLISFLLIFLLAMGTILGALLLDEPVEISLDSKTCLGFSNCYIGETIGIKIKLNENANFKIGSPTAEITSDILNIREDVSINQSTLNSPISLKIPLSVSEGSHNIYLDNSFSEYNNLFLNLLLRLKHSLSNSKAKTSIDLVYPKVALDIEDNNCNSDGYSIEKIDLRFIEGNKNGEINCKIRIYVDEDTKTSNPDLKNFGEYNGELDYYETEYYNLKAEGKYDGIQQINFNTAIDTQRTNAYVIPVCKIDDSEVEITNQKELLNRCSV